MSSQRESRRREIPRIDFGTLGVECALVPLLDLGRGRRISRAGADTPALKSRAGWVVLLSAMLVGVAAWQFGQGWYIHAKAGAAQVLLHSAWQRTLAGEREARPWP